MRIALLALVSCSAALGLACASSPGRLESNRFQNDLYPYALFYVPAGTAEYPLGPHYTLENFHSPDGHHRYPRLGSELTIDRTYRDETPAMVGRESFYDLLFTRDGAAATLWLRSVPLPVTDRETALDALAQRYVEAAAKTGRAAPPFGVEASAPDQPSEIRDVRTRACELSKRAALRLDFTLKNPAAAHQINEPEWLHASVVLIRTGYFARVHYPVLLLAASVGGEAPDPALDRDFERMLDLLVLGDKGQGLSMHGEHTCGSAAPAPTEGAAPAPTREGTSGDQRAPTLEVPIIQEDAPSPAPAAP